MNDLIEALKGYILPIILRWALKFLGGALIGMGLSEPMVAGWLSSTEAILLGIVTFAIGVVVSLVNHKTAISQNPPPFKG